MALSDVPFLGGYLQQKQANEQQPIAQMQKLGLVLGLADQMQKRDQIEQYRADMAALGPNPSQEALAKVASKYGGPDTVLKIHQASLDRQAQLAAQVEDRRRRLEQQTQHAETIHEWRMLTARTQQDRAAEQERHNKAMEALTAQNALLNAQMRELQINLQRDRQTTAQQNNLDRQVTAFANELQQNKLPALYSSLSTANQILGKYEDGDIPGFGVVAGSGKVPDMLRSSEAKEVRSAVQAVSNDLLNLYSGLAVTLPESERRQLEEMRGGNFTSEDFKTAWPRIVSRFNTVMGNQRAGASAEVLKEYQSRPGAIKLDPIKAAFSERNARRGPKVGDVVDGYEYIGGDPAKPESWRKK